MKNNRTYRGTATAPHSESHRLRLAETLKAFAADNELKSEVLFCPRFKPSIGWSTERQLNMPIRDKPRGDARAHSGGKWEMEYTMIEDLPVEHPHLAPYDILTPFDLPSCDGIQY